MHIPYTPDAEAPKYGQAIKADKRDLWLGRYVSTKQQRCPKRTKTLVQSGKYLILR